MTEWEGKKLNSPNDIVVNSDGSIWFTDPPGGLLNVGMVGDDLQKYHDIQPVYRISPDGKDRRIVTTDFVYPERPVLLARREAPLRELQPRAADPRLRREGRRHASGRRGFSINTPAPSAAFPTASSATSTAASTAPVPAASGCTTPTAASSRGSRTGDITRPTWLRRRRLARRCTSR